MSKSQIKSSLNCYGNVLKRVRGQPQFPKLRFKINCSIPTANTQEINDKMITDNSSLIPI